MSNTSPRYERRLNRAHFVHLHAVAEGLAPEDAAQRFLAADSRAAARQVHEQTVQVLRAIVQRRGDPRWRLVMLIGRIKQAEPSAPVLDTPPPTGPSLQGDNVPLISPQIAFVPPTFEQWIEASGIEPGDWGERELLEFYEDHCREAALEAAQAITEGQDERQAADQAVHPAQGHPRPSISVQQDAQMAEC